MYDTDGELYKENRVVTKHAIYDIMTFQQAVAFSYCLSFYHIVCFDPGKFQKKYGFYVMGMYLCCIPVEVYQSEHGEQHVPPPPHHVVFFYTTHRKMGILCHGTVCLSVCLSEDTVSM